MAKTRTHVTDAELAVLESMWRRESTTIRAITEELGHVLWLLVFLKLLIPTIAALPAQVAALAEQTAPLQRQRIELTRRQQQADGER